MARISNFVISHLKLEFLIPQLKQREGNPLSYINLEKKSLGEQQCHIHFRSTHSLHLVLHVVKHKVTVKLQIKQRCFINIDEEYNFISNYKPSSGLKLASPKRGTALFIDNIFQPIFAVWFRYTYIYFFNFTLYFFFFFDNPFPLNMRHNPEEKICYYLCYIVILEG